MTLDRLGRLGAFGHRALLLGLVITAGLAWLLVDIAIDEAAPSITGDVYERIDAYVTDQLDDSRIPGAALAVVDAGATVHTAGFGTDGRGNAITADTPFWIGSNTKSMTALAVMQLAEDDLIDLDAPVQDYLPTFELADVDAAAKITVRHLLNQTSGISRIDGLRAVAAGRDQTMADTVADMADLELDRPVGETFEYSNLNSVVLGVVIESVTGQTWTDYVTQHVFEPLAMNTTFTDQDLAEAAGLTDTHRSFFGFPLETGAEHLDGLVATGYVYSTATDMARYLAMYLDDGEQLLSPAGIDEMLTAASEARTFDLQGQSFTAGYGAGWFIGEFGVADDARWHQGSLPHFTAWMVLLPDTDQAVVVLLNEGNQFEIGGANAAWSRIPQGIVNLLRDADPPGGIGSARFFILFGSLVAAVVVAEITTLADMVRNGLRTTRTTWRLLVPLMWEIGLGGLALVAYPVATGGLRWGTAFAFVPDLTLTVVVIAGLAVITGAVRTALLLQRRSRDVAGPDIGEQDEPEPHAIDALAVPEIDRRTVGSRR